jgi:hypothetical protein
MLFGAAKEALHRSKTSEREGGWMDGWMDEDETCPGQWRMREVARTEGKAAGDVGIHTDTRQDRRERDRFGKVMLHWLVRCRTRNRAAARFVPQQKDAWCDPPSASPRERPRRCSFKSPGQAIPHLNLPGADAEDRQMMSPRIKAVTTHPIPPLPADWRAGDPPIFITASHPSRGLQNQENRKAFAAVNGTPTGSFPAGASQQSAEDHTEQR